MYNNVIHGIKPAAMVVGDDCLCLVWWQVFHVDQSTSVGKSTLLTEEDTILIIDSAVGHINPWIHFLTSEAEAVGPCGAFNLGDLDLLLAICFELVTGDPDLVCGGHVDASLMSKWIGIILQDHIQLGSGA